MRTEWTLAEWTARHDVACMCDACLCQAIARADGTIYVVVTFPCTDREPEIRRRVGIAPPRKV